MRGASAPALFGLIIVTCATAASGEPSFPYDRVLATDLASAYVRAAQRAQPDRAPPGIDYDHPDIVARVANGNRRLVFIAYRTAKPSWGASVTLEVCAANSDLTVVDVTWVDGIEKAMAASRSVTKSTFVALPQVCPDEVP